MTEKKMMGKIFGIALVFVMIGTMLGRLASIGSDSTSNAYASSSYDVQAAVNYAETWWNGRNTGQYHDYGDYDCANFVSQCLIAGGLDLSAGPGVDEWGCIPSVTNLDYNLRHYQNTQYQVGGSEPLWVVKGDPIIFYSNDGTHHHSAFGVVGDVSHYWLGNAHGINCYHKPISWFLSDPNLDYCVYFHIKGGTPGQPPTEAPTHISPHNGATDVLLTPTFQWGSVANADYYALYISKPPYGEANLVFDSEVDYGPICGTSFNLPSGVLSEGVTYHWNMSAWNEAGKGPISSAWSFTTTGVCPYSCWDRSALSGNELGALVRSHFPLGGVTQTGESIRVTAYAVAKAESGGNPSACGDNDRSVGLWQINIDYHPEYDKCLLFEEDYNANATREISNNGKDWNAWCTWEKSACGGNGNEAYKQYLTQARKHFYPKVTSLSVSQTSINLGEAVRIYYSASDDVGLVRVELWRTIDKDGAPEESNWAKVPGKEVSVSGTTYSGYFDDDSHGFPGVYWYGIHVVDNSGAAEAWNDERNSRTGGSPGVFGPIKIEVIHPPQLSDGYVKPTGGIPSTDFYYYVTYFDPDGDDPNVKQVVIDGTAYTMSWYSGLNSHITYRYGPKNLSASESHYYFFYFEDSRGDSARLPSGNDMYLGPSVTPETYPPQVTTNAASNIFATKATLNGYLDSTGGLNCQVWFDYGTSTSYGYSTTKVSKSSTGSFSAGLPYSPDVPPLNPDTTYHFRACASNSKGTSYGLDMTFKTEKETYPPVVTASAASDVTTTSATLNGYLYSTGGLNCQVWFDYGTSTSYEYSTTKVSKSSTGSFSAAISGLTSGTTYHFRACASNSEGTRYGAMPDSTFTTQAETTPPVVSSVSPENGATDVRVDTVVTVTFSEAMDSSTITTESFILAGSLVSGTVTYNSDNYTATFTPESNLDYGHEYTATLSIAITDEAGNPLVKPYAWSFSTSTQEITGSISGRVIDTETGDPISDALIWVFDYHYVVGRAWRWQYYGSAHTDSDGYYTVSGLPTEEYAVWVHAAGYASEWYQDAYRKKDCSRVPVTAPADTPDIDFSLEPGGSISGRVINTGTGDPVSGAHIDVFDYDPLPGEWLLLDAAETDSDGYYTVYLPTGEYGVWVYAAGYASEWYQDAYTVGDADPVSVAAPNDTPDINFSLEPGGSISGRAVDAETGETVSNARIWVFDYDSLSGDWLFFNFADTHSDGYYTVPGLPIGEYAVWVYAAGYASEWYQDAYTAGDADPVSVTAPADTRNIDFSLTKQELEGNQTELKYDDGVARDYISMYPPIVTGYLIDFTPPTSPFTIEKVRICGTLGSDWERDNFEVNIWDKDRKVLYSTTCSVTLFSQYPQHNWVEVEIPDIEVVDKFYIHVYTGTGRFKGIHIGADDSVTNEHSNVTVREGDTDKQLDYWPYNPDKWFGDKSKVNWMIRVVGIEPVLDSIAASPSEVSLNVGGTQPLTITATYSDLSEADATANATYASDNTTVATVSDAGLITAVAEGEATITVSYTEGVITVTAEVSVTVTTVPADILAYYRACSGDASVVDTVDLLKAADDWNADITPPGFTESITTEQLLALADEWLSS